MSRASRGVRRVMHEAHRRYRRAWELVNPSSSTEEQQAPYHRTGTPKSSEQFMAALTDVKDTFILGPGAKARLKAMRA